MEQTSANRTTLLVRKNQAALAKQGVHLLKAKRDALLGELVSVIDKAVSAKAELARALSAATGSLAFAEALDGRDYLESLSLARAQRTEVSLHERRLWGVRILEIEAVARAEGEEPSGTTARTMEAAHDFERVVDKMLALVPLEVRMVRLGAEIKSTSRRVNALDQILVPSLDKEIATIAQVLEEIEREDSFRLRRAKKQRERRTRSSEEAGPLGR